MPLRDYFNSFNFYRNSELPRNQIGRSGVQVEKENEKFTVVCSHSHENLNLVISRCCFVEDIKEMYQNLNVRAERLFLPIKPFALRGCRCRCLSSLISITIAIVPPNNPTITWAVTLDPGHHSFSKWAVQNSVKMYFSVTSLIF